MTSNRRLFMKVAAAASAAAGRILGAPAKQRGPQVEAVPMLQSAAASSTPVKPYLAMVVQSRVISATSMTDVHRNVEHVCKLIDQYLKGVWQLSGGGTPKLVVFPESFLHGYGPMKT